MHHRFYRRLLVFTVSCCCYYSHTPIAVDAFGRRSFILRRRQAYSTASKPCSAVSHNDHPDSASFAKTTPPPLPIPTSNNSNIINNINNTVQVPTLYGLVECVPRTILLPPFGNVTIFEASATAQDRLVDWALLDKNNSTADTTLLQDPYGAVLWPAASAVATYCLTHVASAASVVLELGCGTGLVSLALASLAQPPPTTVLATDYEPLPLQLLQYAAQQANLTPCQLQTQPLDLTNATAPLPIRAQLVVAADVLYDAATAVALAHRVVEALTEHGATVILGDSPGRPGRPVFDRTLARLLAVRGIQEEALAWRTVTGYKVTGPRHTLICGPHSTSVAAEATLEAIPIDILHLEPSDLLLLSE